MLWPLELLIPLCMQGITLVNQSVIINLNARSFSIEKLDELNVTFGIHDVSVLCVTETWFMDYMGNDSLYLHGFNLERKYRKNGRA